MPTRRKELVTLRVPRQLCDEVRSVAAREGETQATIFRRLLRRAIEQERERRKPGNEAA